MNLIKSLFVITTFAMLCSLNSVFAQSNNPTATTVVEEKKKFKVQLLSDGRVIPPNRTLTKTDSNIQLKFFSIEAKKSKELVPSEISINVVRHGKRIAHQILNGAGSIANLSLLAENDDTFLFEVKEIFEKNIDGTLKSYAKGSAKFSYIFFDVNFVK